MSERDAAAGRIWDHARMPLSTINGGRLGRRHRYDVVFYTPWIGSLLSPAAELPTGGAETQVHLLSRELARSGLRVAVVAYEVAGLPTSANGVDVIARPRYRQRPGLRGKVEEVLTIWRSLWRAPSRVIVRRGGTSELPLIGLFARLTGTRLLFASASLVDFDYRKIDSNRRNLILYKLGVRLADTIIVQSEEQVAMCRTYFGREPVMIKSLATTEPEVESYPNAFLWIGRFVSYKRPLAYIDLAKSLPHARFQMVGVPSPRGAAWDPLASEVISEAALVENLELLEPRPRHALMELVAHAVAVVNTSEFEGMPNTFLEAWSRGVPVMALSHDPNGVITRHQLGSFAGGSADMLREQADQLWAKRTSRAELAHRCRQYIVDQHSAQAVANQWATVLRRAGRGGVQPRPSLEDQLTCAE